MPITLALSDDHNLIRKGIIALLRDYTDVEVMMEASNGSELIEQLVCRQPDIILLNIEIPVVNVYHTLDALKEKFPGIKLIVLMMHYDESRVINLMERHFDGSELGGVVAEIDKLFGQRFDALVNSLELGKPPRGLGGSGSGSGHGGGGRRPRHLH